MNSLTIRTLKILSLLTLLLGSYASSVSAKAVEGVVNLNTATAQELTLLPGVGQSKADQIIALRQTKPFATVEELKAIKGLGAARLEALRPHVSFTGPTTAKAVKVAPAAAAPAAGAPVAAAPVTPVAPVSPAPSAPASNLAK